MRAGRVLGVAIVSVTLLCGIAPVRATEAEEAAAAPAAQPVQTEVIEVSVGSRMLAADAEELMQRLTAEALASGQSLTPSEEPVRDEETSPNASRVIEVPTPTVVNPSALFVFEDLTGRAAEQPQLTMEQRRALVEAFRQSIVRDRTKRAATAETPRKKDENHTR
jgi:hypothetical protein